MKNLGSEYNHQIVFRVNDIQYNFLCSMSERYGFKLSVCLRLILDSFIPQSGIGDLMECIPERK